MEKYVDFGRFIAQRGGCIMDIGNTTNSSFDTVVANGILFARNTTSFLHSPLQRLA
jgi:hypothetical protein